MRFSTDLRGLAIASLACVLAACGSGSGSKGSDSDLVQPQSNLPPIIESSTQTLSVSERDVFSYTANASDPDGSIVSHQWELIEGLGLELSGSDTATVSFSAPSVQSDNQVELKLTVKDDKGVSTDNRFIVQIKAYEELNANTIPDPAFLACLQDAELDFGATAISCSSQEISSIEGIQHFSKLRELELVETQVENISILSSLTNLQVLKLRGNPIANYGVTNQLKSLTELSLATQYNYDGQLSNLDLSTHNALSSVTLEGIGNNIITLSGVVLPSDLGHLSLTNVFSFESEKLTALTQLSTLNLDNVYNINSVAFVKNMPQLNALGLSSLPIDDTNSSFISAKTNLTSLTIEDTLITSYSFVRALNKLEELVIKGPKWGQDEGIYEPASFDTNDLNNSKTITLLTLDNLSLQNVTSLASHPQLVSFKSDSSFSPADISWIASLTSLETLRLYEFNGLLGSASNLPSTLKQFKYRGDNVDLLVLRALPNLQELDLYGRTFSNIDSLNSIPELKELTLSAQNLVALPPINNLNKLLSLNINVVMPMAITNLTGLKSNNSIQTLSLTSALERDSGFEKVDDISAITELPNLSSVILSGFQNVEDINAIGQLNNLEALTLNDFSKLASIEPLAASHNLEHLSLTNLGVDNIAFVKALPKLQTLSLNKLDNLLNAKTLTDMTGLTSLSVLSDYILCEDLHDIKSTFAGRSEKRFYFSESCVITPVDFDLFEDDNLVQLLKAYNYRDANLAELKLNPLEFYSDGMQYVNLTTLQGLKQFTKLNSLTLEYFDSTNFLSFSELASFAELSKFSINYSVVEDLTPLYPLRHLSTLNLIGNKLKCDQLEELKSTLPNTEVDAVTFECL